MQKVFQVFIFHKGFRKPCLDFSLLLIPSFKYFVGTSLQSFISMPTTKPEWFFWAFPDDVDLELISLRIFPSSRTLFPNFGGNLQWNRTSLCMKWKGAWFDGGSMANSSSSWIHFEYRNASPILTVTCRALLPLPPSRSSLTNLSSDRGY